MLEAPDPDRIVRLAEVADVAAANSWSHQVVDSIRKLDNRQDTLDLAGAFLFPTRDDDPQVRNRFGVRVFGLTEGAPPSALEETPDAVCELWAAVAARASHPRIRARLHDLLFERRWGNVGEHALGGVAAYIEYAQQPGNSHDEVDSMQRAFQLIRFTKNDELLGELVKTAVSLVDRTLVDTESPKPGISLPLIEVLVDSEAAVEQAAELLRRARVAYSADPWNLERTIGLQRRLSATDEERAQLDSDHIRVWLDAAGRVNPLVSLSHLQRAADLARNHGLSELYEEALNALQAIDPASLPMQSFRTEIQVPRDEIRAWIDGVIEGADSWIAAVMRIVLSRPPSGNVADNRETVANNAAAFPLQAFFPRSRIGVDGLPRYQPTTDDEIEEDRLVEHECMMMSTIIQMTHIYAFERIGDHFGAPSVEDVSAFLEYADQIDDETKSAIGRVIDRYYSGDHEAVVYTGLPIIERLVRNLLLSMSEAIFRPVRARNSVVAGHAAFLYSLMRPWQRVVLTTCIGGAGVPAALSSSAWGGR